jgi:hypothetical protein
MTPLTSRTWKRIGLAILLVVLTALLALRYAGVTVMENLSARSASSSSVEAERAGVLVARPALRDSTVRIGTTEARVLDIWYEQETRLEYTLLVRPRKVPLGRVRLVAHVRLPPRGRWDGSLLALSGVEDTDTLRIYGTSAGNGTPLRREFTLSAVPYVVDTLRLVWEDG